MSDTMATGAGPALPGQDSLDHQVLGLRDGRWELLGSRCPVCARNYYPPRELCAEDLARCDTAVLSRTGTVYAAAEVHLGPVGFPAPYWVAWVDLPEAVRVYTILDVPEGGQARPGDPVELAPRVVRTEPHPVLGPVFRLSP